MTSRPYTRNHYVPKWYQHRFLFDTAKERKFFYLDLNPGTFVDARGTKRCKTALRRWGPALCFRETDLYTTKFGNWESTEIEKQFFGRVDALGRMAVDYFSSFQHPNVNSDAYHALMPYMSIQKLRTPKGLSYLSEIETTDDTNSILFLMQDIQNMHCAIWTECVWSIADASQSDTKFIISDHPVTIYNQECFPRSKWCRQYRDPDIGFVGTHTLFPLSLDKILILTNMSWVRNPYRKATRLRPNPDMFRRAIFNFMSIQTGRELSEMEVNKINFIIKKRALRYIAAAREEWLYPERRIPTTHWSKIGEGYLLMPDPRSVTFRRQILIGYSNKRSDAFDEYGREPWQEGFNDDELADREWDTFHAFQGEYARLFGPKRRGQAFNLGRLDDGEDDADYHEYHLSLQRKHRPIGRRRP